MKIQRKLVSVTVVDKDEKKFQKFFKIFKNIFLNFTCTKNNVFRCCFKKKFSCLN